MLVRNTSYNQTQYMLNHPPSLSTPITHLTNSKGWAPSVLPSCELCFFLSVCLSTLVFFLLSLLCYHILFLCVKVRDFVHPTGSVSLFREEAPSTRADSSLLSSLSFWLLNDSASGASKPSTPSEIKARKTASKCVKVRCLFIAYQPKNE